MVFCTGGFWFFCGRCFFLGAGCCNGWQLGLNGTQLYNDRESITQALRSGAPVIAAVRPGTFTNVGHYIVLYGIDDANQIGVYDPNSASRSARRWGVVEVLNEVEAMWAYY